MAKYIYVHLCVGSKGQKGDAELPATEPGTEPVPTTKEPWPPITIKPPRRGCQPDF